KLREQSGVGQRLRTPHPAARVVQVGAERLSSLRDRTGVPTLAIRALVANSAGRAFAVGARSLATLRRSAVGGRRSGDLSASADVRTHGVFGRFTLGVSIPTSCRLFDRIFADTASVCNKTRGAKNYNTPNSYSYSNSFLLETSHVQRTFVAHARGACLLMPRLVWTRCRSSYDFVRLLEQNYISGRGLWFIISSFMLGRFAGGVVNARLKPGVRWAQRRRLPNFR